MTVSLAECEPLTHEMDPEPIPPHRLREVAGHFATGICVITAEDPVIGPHGMTLNSLTTVSADPASLLICLNRGSTTHKVVLRAGRFAVNVLGTGQEGLAELFATKRSEKFRQIPWHRSSLGTPLLSGAIASLECVVTQTHDVHTHTVVCADVVDAAVGGGSPLLFHAGRLTSLGGPE